MIYILTWFSAELYDKIYTQTPRLSNSNASQDHERFERGFDHIKRYLFIDSVTELTSACLRIMKCLRIAPK